MTVWQPTGEGRLWTAIHTHDDPAGQFDKHTAALPDSYQVTVAHDPGCPCFDADEGMGSCSCSLVYLLAKEAA